MGVLSHSHTHISYFHHSMDIGTDLWGPRGSSPLPLFWLGLMQQQASPIHSNFQTRLMPIYTVQRYALHGLSYRNSVVRLSVRLSVRHTRGLCPHGSTYDHNFFTIWYPHQSSFWGYHVHPKIRKGSSGTRALNEGGVAIFDL